MSLGPISNLARMRMAALRYGAEWRAMEIAPTEVMGLLEIADAAKAHLENHPECDDEALRFAVSMFQYEDV